MLGGPSKCPGKIATKRRPFGLSFSDIWPFGLSFSCHFGLLGVHFPVISAFWTFISFHFGFLGLHFLDFGLLGFHFFSIWACRHSFPSILKVFLGRS